MHHLSKWLMLFAVFNCSNVATFNVFVYPSKVLDSRFQVQCTLNVDRDEFIKSRTMSWLNQWVIGLKLCPWAPPVMHNGGLRLIVVNGSSELMATHVGMVIKEANKLSTKWDQRNKTIFRTTLMVFPEISYIGGDDSRPCGDFPASIHGP